MWKRIECVAIYTENIESSVAFYENLGLTKAWETYQDSEKQWKLIGMKYPEGETQLVLKNNPNLNFVETEIVVDDVVQVYNTLREDNKIEWIQVPFLNPNGGHVAVMQAPDGNVFVIIGK